MKGKPQERIATWRLSPLQALEGPQTRMRMRTHAQPPPPPQMGLTRIFLFLNNDAFGASAGLFLLCIAVADFETPREIRQR